MRLLPLVALACLASAGPMACSSGSSGGSGSGAGMGDAAVIGCGSDVRAQAYKPNMGQMGAGGNFRFVLVSATPAPLTTGTEKWVVKILDASGKPVTDATFPSTPSTPNPRPWMPEHGHGSPALVEVTNNGDGTYTFDPVYLFMLGLWETDIVVQSGSKTDSTKFFFCLQ